MLKQRPVRHCFHIRSLCRSRAHVTMNISAYSSAAAAQQNMVQQLVGRARTWAGKPDNAAGLQSLSAVLSDLPIQQLGFQDPAQGAASPKEGFLSKLWRPEEHSITYIHIYEDPTVSIGIFCLPKGAQLPLHNHPGMTVLSRVLYGKMRVRSYDWEASDQDHPELPFSSAGASAWARQVLNQVAEPHHQPAALFPASGGNIHEFTAVEGSQCAVLDVLAPPYDIAGGRDCTYYREARLDAKQPGRALLEVCNPPSSFVVRNRPYTGLPIC